MSKLNKLYYRVKQWSFLLLPVLSVSSALAMYSTLRNFDKLEKKYLTLKASTDSYISTNKRLRKASYTYSSSKTTTQVEFGNTVFRLSPNDEMIREINSIVFRKKYFEERTDTPEIILALPSTGSNMFREGIGFKHLGEAFDITKDSSNFWELTITDDNGVVDHQLILQKPFRIVNRKFIFNWIFKDYNGEEFLKVKENRLYLPKDNPRKFSIANTNDRLEIRDPYDNVILSVIITHNNLIIMQGYCINSTGHKVLIFGRTLGEGPSHLSQNIFKRGIDGSGLMPIFDFKNERPINFPVGAFSLRIK